MTVKRTTITVDKRAGSLFGGSMHGTYMVDFASSLKLLA